MNFLVAVDICTSDYEPVWNIVGLVVNIIKIGIPIVLIVFGMIDLSKAVISGKEEEQKKATKLLGKRFLYAVGVFASVWIVTLVLDLAAGTIGKNNEEYKYDEAAWKRCWALINGDVAVSDDEACYLCNNKTYAWGNFSNNNNCKLQSSIRKKSECSSSTVNKSCYMLEQEGIEPIYIWESDTVARKLRYTLVNGVTSEEECAKKNK